MTLLLYVLAILIWGTTWYAMIFQLGEVAPSASLTYRYIGAGLVLLALAWASGRRVALRGREHLRCMAQGGLMFSVSYWLTYMAAEWLTTGLIALMFASASAMTMVLNALLERTVPSIRAMAGAVLGITGVALVFWPEVAAVPLDGPEVRAGLMCGISVLLFAAGGIVGARNQARGMPRFATIGWSMIYGAALLAGLTLLRGEAFTFDWSVPYLASLFYLMLFGSVAVFILYFEVIERLGAEKASYATVLFPLVALGVSTVFEDYHWPALALIGVPLALAGNALVLMRGRSPEAGGGAQRQPQPLEGALGVVKGGERRG